jgi:uncharacterized protein (TIGR03118 family)
MSGRTLTRSMRRTLALGMLVAIVASSLAVTPVTAQGPTTQIAVIPAGSAYRQRNLVSDVPGMALVQDPVLVNPWGISRTALGPFRVANNGTGTSSSYRRDVGGFPLVPRLERLTIPGSLPTGTVSSASNSDFVVTSGSASGASRILFASMTGNIVGWSTSVPAAGSTTGVIAASHAGRVYMGLTATTLTSGNTLYAADFANGNVDVYTNTFALTTVSGGFSDPTIPTTAGNVFHPFNVQYIGGLIYVTYAKVGPDGWDEPGVGNGFVRRFNTDGVRDLTFGINNGPLNSPWGIVVAPSSFGIFGGALLVGNAGPGNPSIHAFNPTTGAFLGTIQNEAGDGIVIDKLHALVFGNGGDGGTPGTLYFTAGVGQMEHGLFGSLSPTTASATSTVQFSTDEYVMGEASKSIQITVTRNGSAANTATVRYATWDQSLAGHASQKSDYQINAGVLTFAPGVTSQTFTINIVSDRFVEGDEVIDLVLSNPAGTGVGLGSPNASVLKIVDNDTVPGTNPIDVTSFFVRQHFLDFLKREPSTADMTYWSGIIDACGTNTTCRTAKRNEVSSRFMLLAESVDSTGLVFRLERAALGGDPLYGDVMLLTQVKRDRGTNEMLHVLVTNPRFVAAYGSASNTTFVNTLDTQSGYAFSTTKKNAWISALNGATLTRAQVLLQLAQDAGYQTLVRNRWIVLSGYWAYFRRDPDKSGFNTRYALIKAGGGNPLTSGLTNDFVTSGEYRQRFGPF